MYIVLWIFRIGKRKVEGEGKKQRDKGETCKERTKNLSIKIEGRRFQHCWIHDLEDNIQHRLR